MWCISRTGLPGFLRQAVILRGQLPSKAVPEGPMYPKMGASRLL